MNSITPVQMFETIFLLPRHIQAACVNVAARMCLPIWEEFEMANFSSKTGTELLDAYEQWSEDKLTDSELLRYAERLYALLPKDLEKEDDPTPGFAGWAIHGVAQVAVGDCRDVLDSIVFTTVLYAAGAVCRSGHKMISAHYDLLEDCERQFLSQWWEKCHMHNLIMNEPR
ncbi:MAG TPA: hypothetical protein VNK04_02660 [Gemmataceae bacterium]|nr:hypothetical protein [Gemmataceae bacterium]